MTNVSQHVFDVLVIGAGPAGIAAAVRASEGGANVGLVDDNPEVGGQIWRGSADKGPDASEIANSWRQRLCAANITRLCGKRVFHRPEEKTFLAEGGDSLCELRYRSLILA